MPYFQRLRAVVGSRPLILVAAGALICNAAGDLLLQRRTDDELWGIPGGSMELGESAEQTARREVWEETGLVIGDVRLFGIFSGPEMRHAYPNGDAAAIVSVVYRTNPAPGQVPTPGDESLELRYFASEALHTVPLSPPDRPISAGFWK
jgi:8-oxo-dGTP pyrophosphatase MutT (NUDIX family)